MGLQISLQSVLFIQGRSGLEHFEYWGKKSLHKEWKWWMNVWRTTVHPARFRFTGPGTVVLRSSSTIALSSMLVQGKNARRGAQGQAQEVRGCWIQSKSRVKGEKLEQWQCSSDSSDENYRVKNYYPRVRNKKEEDRIGSRTTNQKTGTAAKNESKVDWLQLHIEKPKATVDLIIYLTSNARAVQELFSWGTMSCAMW